MAMPNGLEDTGVDTTAAGLADQVAGLLDGGPLRARPVLVVPDGEEHLVLGNLRSAAIAVDAREVGDVVAVGLEEPDHRVLGVEDGVLRAGAGERPKVGRQEHADHGSVCTSTDSTAGRSRTMGVQWSPPSGEA